jgi:hypothetical protein
MIQQQMADYFAVVGPCGSPPPQGPWADGLSIACRNGLIVGSSMAMKAEANSD